MSKRILLAVWAIWHLLLAISCRPVQDDYGYLNVGSNSGFGAYLSNFWFEWGGNLSPSIIRIPFYIPSISGESWVGLGVYSFLTAVLVLFTSLLLTTWLTGRTFSQNNSIDLAVGILTSFGFEGLFSPGVISAFVYGSASSTHLLPICFLIIGLGLCMIQLRSSFSKVLVASVIFIFGFVVGNSNLAEGLSGILVCFSLVVLYLTKSSTFAKLGFLDIWRISTISFGTSIGLFFIALSPGLRNRANLGSGLPNGIQEFALRLRSSLVSFSAEVVTHPVWILVLVVSTILIKKNALLIVWERAQALILFTFFVYSSLVLGASFAYAAWHQSVGLLFLLTPTGVALAALVTRFLPAFDIKIILKKILITILSLLILLLITRVTILEFRHGTQWDENLLINYCRLIENDKAFLIGSEVRYPPIRLGIEDVDTWPWMREDYSKWILSPGFRKKISC